MTTKKVRARKAGVVLTVREMQVALAGAEMKVVLCEHDLWLRNRIKHCDLPAPVEDALQEARDNLNREIRERGLESIVFMMD